MTRIFLLPHPGPERRPPGSSNRVAWGTYPHKRKFLQAPGEWRSRSGHLGKGVLQFWAEYEAPTFAHPLKCTGPGLPRFLQTIDSNVRNSGVPFNSDPWVFGPSFVWTTCRESPLRRTIIAGDVVLFGSVVDSAWVLDTVLVADAPPTKAQRGIFGREYDSLVLPTVPGATPIPGRAFRSIEDPFSFVPALPIDGSDRPFPRPRIDSIFSMLRKSNGGEPPSPRNARSLTACVPCVPLSKLWRKLLKLITGNGCVFGTHFRHPGLQREVNGPQASARCADPATRPRC